MAEACKRCGGVGYGTLDPEFGWRAGASRGQPPVPCPDCEGRFATYQKDAVATSVVDTKKTKRATEISFGKYIAPVERRTVMIDVVGGGDPSNVSSDEYDPGVVNTGSERVSIDAALAQTAGEG